MKLQPLADDIFSPSVLSESYLASNLLHINFTDLKLTNRSNSGFSKISINNCFVVVKEVSGENVVNLKLLKTEDQFLGATFLIGSRMGFNFVEFWKNFGSAVIDNLAFRLLENKTMAAGKQKIVSCVMDETTDLKAKFARLRCKSLRRNSSPRFNTASFSLVHSREKLWSITIFCPRRKKKRKKEKCLCFLCLFFLTERPFI